MNNETLKRRWLKEDEFAIDSALSESLANPQGRKFLWWLLTIGKIGAQPYSGNALNTAFACGELNVGQRILDRIISVSPEGYVRMMQESENERKERDQELGLGAETDSAGEEDGPTDERT